MEQLINKMNELQATTFAFYLKAHNFHWNVRGKDFSQLHEFFGDLYTEVWGAVDTTAEQIRALGSPVAGALSTYQSQSRITDETGVPGAAAMIFSLYYDNNTVVDVLNEAHELATISKQYGLINFIEGRIDTHKKHGWMLSASMDMPVAEQVESAADVVEETTPQETEILTEEVKTYFLNPEQ